MLSKQKENTIYVVHIVVYCNRSERIWFCNYGKHKTPKLVKFVFRFLKSLNNIYEIGKNKFRTAALPGIA